VDPSSLQLVWFGLIGLLWAGYLILEGFDFGVGMLLPILGRDDTERRVMINTIGPVWDGNEVWLITAGGMMFAAFPVWYSTLLSAFYLPILLILVALIIRGVAFEYRGKVDAVRWRAAWDRAIVIGSLLPALLWGVAFGNLIKGLDAAALYSKVVLTADGRHLDPVNSVLVAHPTTSVLLAALNPFSLLTGATMVLLFVVHAAFFLGLKTSGELRMRSGGLARLLSLPLLAMGAVWAVWAQLGYGQGWTWAIVVVAASALSGVVVSARLGRDGVGFLLTSAVAAGAVVMVFGAMYPNVLTVTLDTGQGTVTDVSALVGTSIAQASSSESTLAVMTWVASAMLPVVVVYQSWVYWVFRHRIGTEDALAAAH
jgi:cytochrome bd ubiquinol oxidase subunit II